jgi:signal recognition particle receptor subunit beta
VLLNHLQRELTVKIVYYGPALSGKTTNLQTIHQRVPPDIRSRLLTVENREDRTLFFDLLPPLLDTGKRYRVKLRVFTVPGHIIHNVTRRVVLQGADAVVFVADSQRSAAAANNAYWSHLQQDMRANGLNPAQIPVVIQFNKRDLLDIKTDAEIEETRRRGEELVIAAVAARCDGVLETLESVLELAYRRLDLDGMLSKNIGLRGEQFLRQIFSRIDLAGTRLEGKYVGRKQLSSALPAIEGER